MKIDRKNLEFKENSYTISLSHSLNPMIDINHKIPGNHYNLEKYSKEDIRKEFIKAIDIFLDKLDINANK